MTENQNRIESKIKTAIDMLNVYDYRTCDIKVVIKILNETLALLTEK